MKKRIFYAGLTGAIIGGVIAGFLLRCLKVECVFTLQAIVGCATAAIFLAALIVAVLQLISLRKSGATEVLIHLDSRWENELKDAREATDKHDREIRRKMGLAVAGRLKDEDMERVSNSFHEKLKKLRENDSSEYDKVMSLCGFFETLGFIVTSPKNYLDEQDAYELLGGSVVEYYKLFKHHINVMQQEEYKEAYVNFAKLGKHCIKELTKREEKLPTKSNCSTECKE